MLAFAAGMACMTKRFTIACCPSTLALLSCGPTAVVQPRVGPTFFVQHVATCLTCLLLQEGLVPFNIGVAVRGDITLGVWFGHRNLGQRLHSRAAFSFAFHTAFVESGADHIA